MTETKCSDIESVTLAMTKLEGVTNELAASKAAYVSILKKNGELREMLQSVEEKASAIGRLAKEKCGKLKNENEKLKEQLQQQGLQPLDTAQPEEKKDEQAQGDQKHDETDRGPVIRTDVTTRESETKELSGEVKATESKLDELRSKLKATSAEVKRLNKLREAIEENEAALKSKVTSLQRENESLKTNLHKQSDKMKQVTVESEQHAQEWSGQRAALTTKLERTSQELKKVREELSEVVRTREERVESASSERSALIEQLDSKKAEIEVLKFDQRKLADLLQEAGVDASEVMSE